MKKKCKLLVTGANGFIGSHFIDYVISNYDHQVFIYALDIEIPDDPKSNNIRWVLCDLTDINNIDRVLKHMEVDGVIHFAGITTGRSYHDFFQANVVSSANLWEAVSNLTSQPKIINVGSAAQYGVIPDEPVVTESNPLQPCTIYGVSKYIQEKWTLNYIQNQKLNGCCVRIFNTIGTGQKQHLIPSCFVRQISQIKQGKQDYLTVGNLDTARDFLDVRDIAEALWKLIDTETDINGQIFNIASGQSVKIREILNECLKISNCDPDIVKVDPQLFRKNEIMNIIGDITKIQSVIDWVPRIHYGESLMDMWRSIHRES